MRIRLEKQLEFDFMEGLKSKEGKMIDNVGYGIMAFSTALMAGLTYIFVKEILSEPVKNTIEYIL